MEEILQDLIPLSEGELISKPYNKNDNPKTKWKILERKLNKQKILRNYENIAMCLYWIGKETADKKFTKLAGAYVSKMSRKVYVLVKGNKKCLKYCGRIKIKTWEKLRTADIGELRREMLKVLDGARTNVGEDVNPYLNPNIPQQETTVDQMTGPTGGNQMGMTGNWSEPFELEEALRLVEEYQEEEDSWPMWDELIGRPENTSENLGQDRISSD
jgi:hypothetical protein